ncbi:hypothetical protein AO1008_11192 [Aspergillus oryzae 100-8]|uniref:Uncharacterized protein n=1 Tax=Aspergillus oryzae (strain 3.042) TaxID=1160506 RepID=I8ADF3_ASPO3|nr:hypothetical protein Ao3042_11440 [Aspergillus oryzae 3.042]KDE84608.1 hypothetical protein AO1008_11192 [Aspergillus oryzae 100-8]|eukprot:EIT83279.1 hypothetical protein Ao3042_11440 [Aspergillus oryzae 3.042]
MRDRKPLLSQMIWTQRNAPRHFLYKINAADSDQCHRALEPQISRYILIQFPIYTGLRSILLDKLDETGLPSQFRVIK